MNQKLSPIYIVWVYVYMNWYNRHYYLNVYDFF